MLIVFLAIVVGSYLLGLYIGRKHRSVKFFELTRKVAWNEGKKVSLSIAQINEVVSLTLKELGIKAVG